MNNAKKNDQENRENTETYVVQQNCLRLREKERQCFYYVKLELHHMYLETNPRRAGYMKKL